MKKNRNIIILGGQESGVGAALLAQKMNENIFVSDSAKIEDNYKGKMYSDFKNDLGDIIVELLVPIQKEYELLMKDKGHIENILKIGAEKARNKAYKTLDKVYRKIGLVKRI